MSVDEDLLMDLFEQTRAASTRLESVINAVIGDVPTVESYRQLLVCTYGLEAPLESAIAYTPRLRQHYQLQPQVGELVRDLLALGMRPSAIAALEQSAITPFVDVSTALGWIYLYERSRLHHPLMRARIVRALPEVESATSYLGTDEVVVTTRWDGFMAVLERAIASDIVEQTVHVSAVQAYLHAIEWYGARSGAARDRAGAL